MKAGGMAQGVSLRCACGSLRGVASSSSESLGRIVCMCDDCQAYAHYLGRATDILDSNGGTDVFPLAPSNLRITHGLENLRCLRLTHKGLFRWYAGCCKTPIANTMSSAKIPFAGVIHTIMDHSGDGKTREEALGPIRAKVWGKYGTGNLPQDAHQTASLGIIIRTIRFLLFAWIRRQHIPSPFFDPATFKPKVEPYILTSDEREDLRKLGDR